jgi:hypothetical protein
VSSRYSAIKSNSFAMITLLMVYPDCFRPVQFGARTGRLGARDYSRKIVAKGYEQQTQSDGNPQ